MAIERRIERRADVVFVLLCVQAALALLGMVGLVLLMGNPLYLAGSLIKAAGLLVLAVKIRRGRRWALVTTVVAEWLALLAVWVGALLGLLPGLTPTMTLTGLLTDVGLPVAIGWLCARLLSTAAAPDGASPGSPAARSAGVPAWADPPTVPLPVPHAGAAR